MRRLSLLILPALLVVGCNKNKEANASKQGEPAITEPQSQSALAAKDIPQQNEQFLQAAAKEQGAQTFQVQSPRGSGEIVVLQETAGTGESPKATDVVKVNYRGTLPDGTEFDSSYKRGQPISFPLNRVIPCWTEGLQHMKVGEKAKLTCSAQTAYGARGAPPAIPPNSPLTFEVELLGIGAGQ
jgi:FKBP-type peptidyl-prolyl cis-trans isomerase FkpA